MVNNTFLLSILIMLLLFIYVHFSFKRNIINLYKLPIWVLVILDINILFTLSFRLFSRFTPELTASGMFNTLLNISYVILGFIGLISLLVILLDIENFIHLVTKKNSKNENESRRDFLKKSFTLAGIGTATAITGAGFKNSFDPKINEINVAIDPKFKKLKGLKIVQLSDIHIGPTLNFEFAQKLVHLVNPINPDIVVITGDLVDGEVDLIGKDVAPLKNLKGKLGTFYVTGNHEYYWDGEGWINFVSSLGITSLINENKKLVFNDEEFYICGVPDIHARKLPGLGPDFKKAKANIPNDKFKLLLSHQPVTCFEAVKEGYHLQLSGHTHGGQGFPWNIIVRFVQPYIKGLYNHEGMWVYVNRGTGFWGPPNRFMVDSEITVLNFQIKPETRVQT